MEAYVLIGFLLVFTVVGNPIEEDIQDDENYDNTMNHINHDLPLDEVFNGYDDLVDLDSHEKGLAALSDMEKRVMYYLYTRSNTSKYQQLFLNDEGTLSNSNFDPTKPTKFITHGFINSYKSNACVKIRDAYMYHGDYNIIVIDWSRISLKPYIWSRNRIKAIAKHVSQMFNFLIEHGMNPSETTLVGHSLGAHIVGLAARQANGRFNYLVGLDPALPSFRIFSSKEIVKKSDADHVEIIHTNAGHLGFNKPLGHIDFYPNGGTLQPGCSTLPILASVCSHARSYELFAESINSPVGFVGKQCPNYTEYREGKCKLKTSEMMGGFKLKLLHKGKFFLVTNPKYPFAVGA